MNANRNIVAFFHSLDGSVKPKQVDISHDPLTSLKDWAKKELGDARGMHEIETVLKAQLGRKWSGFDDLTPDERSFAEAWSTALPVSTSAREACDEASLRHAYVNCVLFDLATRMSAQAGRSLTASGQDRRLRALAVAAGLRSVPMDAYANVAQWLAEKGAGRRLVEPCLLIAASSLREIVA